MIKFFYNIMWWIILIVGFLPMLFLSLVRGEKISHRLGLWKCRNIGGIWIHSSSLGETASAVSLASAILSMRKIPVILTATTLSGYERLLKNAPKDCEIFLQPLDRPLCVDLAMKRCRAKILVVLEGDLWLGMVSQAKKMGAKVIVASAVMSKRTAHRAKSLKKYFLAMWQNIDKIFAKSPGDRERFISAGFPAEKIEVFGDLKMTPPQYEEVLFKKPEGYPIIVAGSVRPAEEEIVIKTMAEIFKKYPEALFIMAPRHLERIPKITEKLNKVSLKFSYVSEGKSLENPEKILIMDVFGELKKYYSIADIAIIGGTFADYGGHNPMEAIFAHTPVVHGKYFANNKELFEIADGNGAAIMIDDENEMAAAILKIIEDKDRLENMKKKCALIEKNAKNISKKYAARILAFLDDRS
ncbi:hypothetical protein J7M00_03705 [bacterium]|nr:hypothetical protein [bacterium]